MISVEVKTCLAVDLLRPEDACDGSISASSLSLILLVIHAARILRREESRIIGLRFDGRPFALFGFWSGFNMSYVTSFGMSPVSAMLLYILAIRSCILSGAYFISSTGISSHPGLSFGFILAIAFRISLVVNGIVIRVDGMIVLGCYFYRTSLKNISQ